MQLSLKKAVTFALLGIGSVIPSAHGAPTDLSQVKDVPRSERSLDTVELSSRALFPRKPCQGGSGGDGSGGNENEGGSSGRNDNHPEVVNVEDRGYTVAPVDGQSTAVEKAYHVFASKDNNPDTNVADIRVNSDENTITLDDVNLQKDPAKDRPRLYEVAMSLFVHRSKKNPNDLQAIHAEAISEPETVKVLERARNAREKANEINEENPDWATLDLETYSINRSSAGIDLVTFQDFMANSAFGRSAERMSANTPGFNKRVTNIEVSASGGDDDSNAAFFFA